MTTRESLNILGQSAEAEGEMASQTDGLSRRKFLKIIGAASTATGVAACADSPSQKILPFVRGDTEQIPGVAVWYNSTCGECSAGCGIMVRTREGRTVKIEGNEKNPINRGGLCALGQASLQSLYDPDRVRQPLERVADAAGRPVFKPIAWEDAYARITDALGRNKKKKILLTGEVSGAMQELVDEWSGNLGFTHTAFDLSQPVALAKAAEQVFGTYGIPEYRIDQADVVLNFGADFLETWVSPCGFARDWANGRKKHSPLKVIHVEPRLSLTGASADLWLNASPGSETAIALALLRTLLDFGMGSSLSPEVRSRLVELTREVSMEKAAEISGVPREKLLVVAEELRNAPSGLVLAGGASTATSDSSSLMLASCFLNLVLGAVGRTVRVTGARKPRSSVAGLRALVDGVKKSEVGVVFVQGTNPVFSAPSSLGVKYALMNAELVVSFSSHLDDTTELANLILPSHTSLESWGDSRVAAGVYGLMQPTMKPVFDTRGFGDSLLEIERRSGKAGAASFQAYLKSSWEKLYGTLGMSGGFEQFWLESVERGGYFAQPAEFDRVKVKVSQEAYNIKFAAADFDEHKSGAHGAPVVLPYMSVKTFDGRSANRPWLQELPDPITQVVWDSWVEIHPDTAKGLGIAQGDFVKIGNFYGEIDVPAYLTEYVHRDVVAVPIGQGHTNFGRYARKVGGGNVIDLLPATTSREGNGVALLSTRARVSRGRGKSKMVITAGSDSQMGRELARTTVLGAEAAHANGHHAEAAHGESHEKPLQMYEQREHPLYHWGMAINLAACTGCSACVVACYAENNIPVVGKNIMYEGREMSWLRIERYYDGSAEELKVSFLPMMCQHCGNAPCEPVCPVYATYHNEEGMNAMIYNRCVGTRYCSNNCSYKVRRFNWNEYVVPEPLTWQFNPDVTRRGVGVMEKCTFCVQRIVEAKDIAKDLGRPVEDGEIKPACVQSCPTQALTFGNLNDESSEVSKWSRKSGAYKVLDHHINTQPSVSYLPDVKYRI